MIPELGHLAIALAIGLTAIQSTLPLLGAHTGRVQWMAMARPAAFGQLAFVGIAMVCLGWAFLTDDFSVAYVAANSNTALPVPYKISAIWGGHEGSLLLWSLTLAGWTVAVAVFSKSLPLAMRSRILAVMGWVSLGFLLFMLLTSNPFDRLIPAAVEGRDLNPLLQDPGLVIHPPMLYMGYVGFAVAFAFAISALLSGHVDSAWARWTRPWTTVAWVSLTLGIALGSWWAYNELGWGGWWFWDPVENASFMPWLVGTALIHSLAVTEKRGAFKSWTLLLAIFAFSLSLLGTFLVRSGVLVSVHAFANDPARGVYILAFLAVTIGVSLALYAWRVPRISRGGSFTLQSRETFLLANNVLMVSAAATVLLGTLYPLFLDALNLGKISVGPPYFNAVFVPLMLPALALMAIGPLMRWKSDRVNRLIHTLWPAATIAAITGVALTLYYAGQIAVLLSAGVAVSVWALLGGLFALKAYVVGPNGALRLKRPPAHIVGMTIAHVGVGVFAIGVTVVSVFDVERDIALQPGQAVEMGGYELIFQGVQPVQGPNYTGRRGTIAVFDGNTHIVDLYPEKRIYRAQPDNPMTEAAVHAGFRRDLYVSLGEPLGGGAWSAQLHYKPLMRWVWGGTLLMALGGLIAASDRRYRLASRASEAEAQAQAEAAVSKELAAGAAPSGR